MAARVEIKHLSRSFGPLKAVDDVSFSVEQGEILGFLGPNGAGKSTTMKMITGFLPPSAGTAVVCGHDVLEQPLQAKRRIGYLPEGAPSYGEMTPAGFLEFVAGVRGYQGDEARRRVAQAAGRTRLEDALDQRIETLSKGYRRRVGLAQAILHDPEVLVLDEPTDGLDPNQKYEVRDLIREMSREKVIILSTHILEEVDAVCTRAIIIAHGRLLADGTPAELLARSPFHGAVCVGLVCGEPERARQVLQGLQGVAGVETLAGQDGVARFRVLPRSGGGALSSAALGQAAVAAGFELVELQAEPGRMDDVFRQITTADGGARS